MRCSVGATCIERRPKWARGGTRAGGVGTHIHRREVVTGVDEVVIPGMNTPLWWGLRAYVPALFLTRCLFCALLLDSLAAPP